MNELEKKNNLLEVLFKESNAFDSTYIIENHLEKNRDVHFLPLQPLYYAFKSLSLEKMSEYLPILSSEQRQALIDIDFWKKDDINASNFEKWIKIYDGCKDDFVKLEFLKNESFVLGLKSRLNVETFDLEDPNYPEHENFFLTEDSLLLIEFDDSFSVSEELQELIKLLYEAEGVENAYAYIFKIISDGYLNLLEEEYRFKKGRLEDFGIPDYFEALSSLAKFQKIELIDAFIAKRTQITPEVDVYAKLQSLPKAFLKPLSESFELIAQIDGNSLTDKRQQFLKFNFIKLVNSKIVLSENAGQSSLSIHTCLKEVNQALKLGIGYCLDTVEEKLILSKFDFVDLYRIGYSLLEIQRSKINKILLNFNFSKSNEESFLGDVLNKFIDSLFNSGYTYYSFETLGEVVLESKAQVKKLESLIGIVENVMPYIKQFGATWNSILESGKLMDHYYLNYQIDDIDFEALICSSFCLFLLGKDRTNKKLGIDHDEFLNILKIFNYRDGDLVEADLLYKKMIEFNQSMGIVDDGIAKYFCAVFKTQVEGYDISSMKEDDFKHVGGPILLRR